MAGFNMIFGKFRTGTQVTGAQATVDLPASTADPVEIDASDDTVIGVLLFCDQEHDLLLSTEPDETAATAHTIMDAAAEEYLKALPAMTSPAIFDAKGKAARVFLRSTSTAQTDAVRYALLYE